MVKADLTIFKKNNGLDQERCKYFFNFRFYLFYLFIYLFTQYFKRMTHLAKISHSTKWPSINILNSLKTHVIEKSKNIIYTYIHNRHKYILKNAVLSKIKRSNGIIASRSVRTLGHY